MLITKKTKTRDVLPLLTKETFEELLEQVPEVKLKKPLINLPIRKFCEIISDEEAYVAKLLKQRNALKAFGMLKSYRNQMKAITLFIKKYEIKQTQEEKQAAQGIDFPDMVTKIYLTIIKFFGYKTFFAAGFVPFSYYLMILQDEASSLKFQRAYSDIIKQQMRLKESKKRKW